MNNRQRLMQLIIEAKAADPEEGSWCEFLASYLDEHNVVAPPHLSELVVSDLALPGGLLVDKFSVLWLLSAPGRSLKKCPNCGTFYAKHLGHVCVPGLERRGQWNDGQCSACGDYDSADPFGSEACPNCGVEMDGEKKE